ncbi:TIGR02453 family protein [Planktotalea sp.]|uniref:TIGR02453 family protein n=1 Tax=Planktotalea sp. TaxID=2029877 RepID=UPI003296FDC5
MAQTFTDLIPTARAFFGELSQNNTREWFKENKSRYDNGLKASALELLDSIAPKLSDLLEQPVNTKLFRAHRDVRFSKDKTPYSLHLHMLWAPQGNGTQPVYFFGIAEDYVTAGAGIMGFDKTQQADWRAWVSEREGAAFQNKIDALTSQGASLREPELKRVPSPFDKDHPQADLLRRKSFTIWNEIGADAKKDLPKTLFEAFKSFDGPMEDLRSFL